MPVHEINEDIFEIPQVPLAHCISLDFHQNAGLARQVVKLYGGKETLSDWRRPQVGLAMACSARGRIVLPLITKQHYYQKPRLQTVYRAIEALFHLCCALGIETVAVPYMMSCGLDGLDWNDVSAHLHDTFKGSEVLLLICKHT